ncbi:ADP compounds hydrolase NudE [Frateuria aurantia]
MPRLPIIHSTTPLDAAETPSNTELVDLEFSNGERRVYHRLSSRGDGAVIIVPMQDAETVLLAREYAVGVERYLLGLPKGRLEPGETPEQGANRELKEELGFGASRLTVLHNLTLSPAYMTYQAHVVLAEDLYPERLQGDEPEELETVPWKLADLHTLIARDDVSEGRSIAALFIAREYLAGRYVPVNL